MPIEGTIGLQTHKAMELHGVMRSCNSVKLEHPRIEDEVKLETAQRETNRG